MECLPTIDMMTLAFTYAEWLEYQAFEFIQFKTSTGDMFKFLFDPLIGVWCSVDVGA